MTWYIEVLKKYAQFDGRARRKEYWFFTLVHLCIYFGLALLGGGAAAILGRGHNPGLAFAFMIPAYLYILAVFVPSLAVSIRRLHDTGRSGWWLLISLVPFVGGLVLLVLMVQDSQATPNLYGPSPKFVPDFSQMSPIRY